MNYNLLLRLTASVRTHSKWLTDNTDATDFIFSRIFLFLDLLGLRFSSDCICACTARIANCIRKS